MKAVSKTNKSTAILVAGLSLMMLAGSISAFAVPPTQVARLLTNPTITAKCCVPIGPTVQVTEPSTITEPAGTLQIADMAEVQQVETAIGRDDPLPAVSRRGAPSGELLEC